MDTPPPDLDNGTRSRSPLKMGARIRGRPWCGAASSRRSCLGEPPSAKIGYSLDAVGDVLVGYLGGVDRVEEDVL
ncbi:hypothetical protein MLD38_031110 [Melastoma candidum]|uniref:Uncharacterized protein n=1 Tax=Melastoma candidum TaxID=119954 RepID=A0ACB9MN45_9MYRT|nr:hypothetical protein MLD38_031110 [Melastoma candidum]